MISALKAQKNLALAIKNSPLSNFEIAKRVGVSHTTINRWMENGGVKIEHVIKVCEVLNIDFYSLFERGPDYDLSHISSLERKVLELMQKIPKEKYYKLEEVIRLLEED
ncbi:helix-turn-helix domain-containing protein [Vibrio artabrorum]|uniref:helix-turn-helix domain-containing protein n=1 Tax=Vibrio artabrorum TaxID=446374 RepID=UPI0035505A73